MKDEPTLTQFTTEELENELDKRYADEVVIIKEIPIMAGTLAMLETLTINLKDTV